MCPRCFPSTPPDLHPFEEAASSAVVSIKHAWGGLEDERVSEEFPSSSAPSVLLRNQFYMFGLSAKQQVKCVRGHQTHSQRDFREQGADVSLQSPFKYMMGCEALTGKYVAAVLQFGPFSE